MPSDLAFAWISNSDCALNCTQQLKNSREKIKTKMKKFIWSCVSQYYNYIETNTTYEFWLYPWYFIYLQHPFFQVDYMESNKGSGETHTKADTDSKRMEF